MLAYVKKMLYLCSVFEIFAEKGCSIRRKNAENNEDIRRITKADFSWAI